MMSDDTAWRRGLAALRHDERARYFAAACAALAVDWTVWGGLWLVGVHPLAAQAAARGAAGVVAFALYRAVVFRAADGRARDQAVRFVLAVAAVGALSVGLLGLFAAGLPTPLAKLATEGVTFLVNFVVMRRGVFRAGA